MVFKSLGFFLGLGRELGFRASCLDRVRLLGLGFGRQVFGGLDVQHPWLKLGPWAGWERTGRP